MNNREIAEQMLKAKDLSPEWKEVIDTVKEKHKGTDKGKFIELRYEKGKEPIPVCMELYVSRSTLYSWREEIINEIILQAAYKQLLKP